MRKEAWLGFAPRDCAGEDTLQTWACVLCGPCYRDDHTHLHVVRGPCHGTVAKPSGCGKAEKAAKPKILDAWQRLASTAVPGKCVVLKIRSGLCAG